MRVVPGSFLLLVACNARYLSPEQSGADLELGCGPGTACAPIPVAGFPFTHRGDTRIDGEDVIDRYGCSTGTTEAGNEVWYAVAVPSAGRLRVSHPEASGDSVDVDVHILSAADANRCLARGHVDAEAQVQAGTVYVVVDTWAGRDGRPLAGVYDLTIELELLPTGACAVAETELEMRWTSCSSSLPDCYRSGSRTMLSLPSRGPVVKEAHLVTVEDGISGWPTSSRDRIAAHYATSEGLTGFSSARTESWAPSGEGGSRWGEGSTGLKLPAEAEAWYVNLNWKTRPAPGTPMIVRNPVNGRAVVAAAGYETGPGATTSLAGVAEEVHAWLGTGHLSELEVGFAADTTLPFGPIVCTTGAPPPAPPPSTSPPPAPTTEVCWPGATRTGTTCADTVALPVGTAGYAYSASADPQWATPTAFVDLDAQAASLRVAPNFVLSELADESDGRYAVLQSHAVAALQRVRDRVGALNVTAGFLRPPLAGAGSRHPHGDAFDLDPVSASVSSVASACRAEGATTVEAYSTYAHCDWRSVALETAFFPPTPAMASEAELPEISLAVDGDLVEVEVVAGFEEGEPLREWTAYDADGTVLFREIGASFVAPEGTATVEVEVGAQVVARVDL